MKDNKKANHKAGFTMIAIAVLVLSLSFLGGGIYLNSINLSTKSSNSDSIEGIDKRAEANTTSNDVDNIFANTYYNALDVLSEGIYYGTGWLSICPNSQMELNGEIYVKVCNDTYNKKSTIVDKAKNIISSNYINELMKDDYIDYNESLYIKPYSVDKNQEYVGFVSYKVLSQSSDKIVYSIKSKYSKLDCDNNCNYNYKEHKMTLTKEQGKWLVSNIEMPY